MIRSIFVSGAAVLVLSLPLQAQDLSPQPAAATGSAPLEAVATAVLVDSPPVIDGRLDDAMWANVPVMSDFTQREPSDGSPATERTEVRVAFDSDALYVAVWAFDSQASGIVPGEAIRDYEVADSDAILLVLDTYQDEQNGFVFGTTPAGIEYDGQIANEGSGGGFFLGGGGGNSTQRSQAGAGGGFNKNWDGSWTVATTRDDAGWYAEFRIPFSTLRYGSDNEAWGFNIARRVRRLNEEAFWAPVPREFNLYRLNFAGALEGVDPPFRRLATVTPYVLGGTARNYAAGDTEFGRDAEFGGEAKIQVTQGLTLDLTANTDFAQVEVDDQQVNLTRFSLLFPEKRPFFLENAGLFTVGAGGADLFFSRRIGIDGGSPVPIQGGGRLSGRVAGLNVGLLHIRTDGLGQGLNAQPSNAYSVARVSKELPSRSKIGGIFVDRNSDVSGDFNRTYAVDGRVGFGEAITVSSFYGQTETPGLSGSTNAWDLTAGWTSNSVRANATVQEIGENFNPEVGFLPRAGHRYYQLFGMYYIRPQSGLREIRPHVSYFTYRARKGDLEKGFEETGRLHIDTHWQWPDGMELHTGANWVREGLSVPFTVPGTEVTVAPGTYDAWESVIVFNTNRSSKVVLDSRLTIGDFLSGSRRGTDATLTYRQSERLSTSVRIAYNDVSLAGGDFTTTLAGVNLGYFFTPRIYLQSLIQYSDQIDTWSANLRFGWLNTAGTGLFIVYNETQGIEELTGPLGRSLIVKFTRQFSLVGG